jgi:Tol biopolymer transport system component
VAVVSADGRSFVRVAAGGWPPIRWAPSGDALYYLIPIAGGADLKRTSFDPGRGQPIDTPVVVLSGMQWNLTEGTEFDLSPDGRKLAYVRGLQSQHIWALDLERRSRGDTAVARQVTQGTRFFDWAALSPDGRTLAFLRLDGPFDWNFYWVPFEGGPETALTRSPRGYKGNPSWSPDASRFVYLALDSAAPALMMTDRAGQLRERIGTRPPAYVPYYRPSWSVDGHTLVYPSDGGRTQVVLDLRTRTERLVPSPDTLGHVPGIVMAPDGSKLLAAEWRRDTVWARLWRTAVDSHAWSPVPAPSGDNFPLVWSPDGWVYLFNDRSTYLRPLDDLPTIWRMRPNGSRQELYARLPVACLKGFVTMSADGRRLACAVLEREPDVWLATDFDPGRP